MKHRHELAALIPDGGLAVELGVAAGNFSVELLTFGPQIGVLYSIDRWNDHHNRAEYLIAKKRLSKFKKRSRVIVAPFSEALKQFPGGFFDLIYIDGYAHTGQEGGQTLQDWWPKLAPGGIFAGHDYAPQYPQTVAVVDQFAALHQLPIYLTTGDGFPSWWMRKETGL